MSVRWPSMSIAHVQLYYFITECVIYFSRSSERTRLLVKIWLNLVARSTDSRLRALQVRQTWKWFIKKTILFSLSKLLNMAKQTWEKKKRRRRRSMTCDTKNSLEANPGSAYTSAMWKPEASSAQTLRVNFTAKQETSCVQQINFWCD